MQLVCLNYVFLFPVIIIAALGFHHLRGVAQPVGYFHHLLAEFGDPGDIYAVIRALIGVAHGSRGAQKLIALSIIFIGQAVQGISGPAYGIGINGKGTHVFSSSNHH